MILKLFMRIFLRNRESFIKAVKFNNKNYVVSIEEYKSSKECIKSALESKYT